MTYSTRLALHSFIGILMLGLGASRCQAQDHTNHTYQVIAGDFTWHEAKADAEARGGHLVTITSQAEFDYIQALGILPQGGYWLGASDEAEEGVWKWVTGEPWVYNRWLNGEPNDLGAEDYLVASGIPDGHFWNDWGRPDSSVNQYILEIETCSPHKARATAELVNGFVVGASLTDSGCGYTNAPLILIQGGGGSGATARAEVTSGRVSRIIITSAGFDYQTAPRIVIASPPFVPKLNITVSQVKAVQEVVLGRRYILESSHTGQSWIEALAPFTATSESITNEFDSDLTGRFFRLREISQ